MKRYLSTLLTLLLLLTMSSGAFAQSWVLGRSDERVETENPSLRKNSFDEIKELRGLSDEEKQTKGDAIRQMAKEERCALVQENLQKRVDYYQNSYISYLSKYQRMHEILESASQRLENLEAGETETLNQRISVLEELISELNQRHDALIANMVQAQNRACDDDTKNFKTELQNSLGGLNEEKATVIKIKRLLQEDITYILNGFKATPINY